MSNMSYCRFHNTNIDLIDCENELSEMIEEPWTGQQLSDDELRAARHLVGRCLNIVRMVATHAGLSLTDELGEEDLEDAMTAVNTACQGGADKKED